MHEKNQMEFEGFEFLLIKVYFKKACSIKYFYFEHLNKN